MALFTALSYNVHECLGLDGKRDPARIGEIIKASGADIIGLQEVHIESDGRVESHQANFLAAATGLHAVPGCFLQRRNGEFGNTLLTRFRVLNAEQLDMTIGRYEPRGAIDAELEIGGEAVRVIVTHFGLSPYERRCQVTKLLRMLSDARTRVTIVMCDLNEWWPRGRPTRWMEEYFGKHKLLPTFPALCPVLCLDRIWVYPSSALVETERIRNSLTRIASDHLPIKATIQTPEPEILG
ncbi:MAG TPA: endonuclease/exonuclease/phosphatase family protein [Candidatus Binatia bacterium]|nr:endonuclease/exonuclease/phosphatase family protein [Candidatus Binatia bacterium]